MSPRRRRHESEEDPIRTEELVRPGSDQQDGAEVVDSDVEEDLPDGVDAGNRPIEVDGVGPDEEGPPTAGASPAGGRRRRGVALRVLVFLLLGGVVAGLVLGAGRLPGGLALSDYLGPAEPEPAETVVADPRITESVLSCPGPEQVGLDDPTVEEQRMVVRAQAVAAPDEALPEDFDAGTDGEITLDPVPDGESIEESDRGTVLAQDLESAVGARVSATGDLAAGAAGAQWHLSRASERRGLTAAPCVPATTESWLLAGGDEPGRVERIVLVNPGANPVTVRVQVFGGEGELPAPGGQGIVVPPGGRHVLLLDALASGEATPAIRVTSTGGPVAAALGDRWLEGTLDRGLELTVPAAAPAQDMVIPAVPMPNDLVAGSAQLRVVVPGENDAIVQVRALTEDGPTRIEHDVTVVDAGTVTDIDISDLPAGTQALQVTSDVPVTAAARVERREREDFPSEMAWVPATEPVEQLAGGPVFHHDTVAVRTQLVLAAIEPAEVEVVTVDAEGEASNESVAVPEAGNATVRVPEEATSIWVRPVSGTAHAALVAFDVDAAGGTMLAGLPLQDLPLTRDLIDVLPWRP